MKRFLLIMMSLVVVSAFANPIVDDVLMIPKTSVAPVIDGLMEDAPWRYVSHTLAVIIDNADAAEPDDWFDLFGQFRLLWDENYLYMFLTVHDETINTEGGDWQYDGVEVYFDADNSKGETYDGVDDVQLRFNVGEAPDITLIDIGGGVTPPGYVQDNFVYEIVETTLGWDLEVAIPVPDMQLIPDEDFGFDIQINDADASTRENMYRWWANDNNEWQNASLFGTAHMTSSRVVGATLDIPKGSAPTIDAAIGAGEWDDAVEISVDHLDSGNDAYAVDDWWDYQNWTLVKWDADNLYLFCTIWDDIYDIAPDETTGWEFDSVEMFFDGDNSKGETYDGIDDIQIRYNLDQVGSDLIDAGYGTGTAWDWGKDSEYATAETDDGWNLEVAINLVSMQIPDDGSDFGFELQHNDCDEEGTRSVSRWWAPSEPPWSNASYFGEAYLSQAGSVKGAPAVASSYELAQNYPNPFNPTTNIKYSVQARSQVRLAVYDMLGHEVVELVNEVQSAGSHDVNFNAGNLASGIYFYKLEAAGKVLTRKMTLLK